MNLALGHLHPWAGDDMKPKTIERLSLFLFVLYCLDLAWKLVSWEQFTKGLSWWSLGLALCVRFGVMAGLLFLYLRAKKQPTSQ